MSTSISGHVAKARASKNPVHLLRAAVLAVRQRRTTEILHSVTTLISARPSEIDPIADDELRGIMPRLRTWVREPWRYHRDSAIATWGKDYAMHLLPSDFAGSRSEGVACGPDYVALGEYEMPAKRVFIVTRTECHVIDHYVNDPRMLHIHALCYDAESDALLVSTGDASKVLDAWDIRNGKAAFRARLRSRLAGHTAMQQIGSEVYLGTDFSSRPNYIETLAGSRYYFPQGAFRSYVVKFLLSGRYVVSLNKEIAPLGGKLVVSIFDTDARRFVLCEDLDALVPREDDADGPSPLSPAEIDAEHEPVDSAS